VDEKAVKLFEVQTRQKDLNDNVLLDILQRNKNTKYNKDKGLDIICSIDEFREKVSVTSYAEYKDYVDSAMKADETDVLGCGKPVYFSVTSGTSATPKIFPLYTPPAQMPRLAHKQLNIPVSSSFPALYIVGAKYKDFTQGGIPIGAVSVYLLGVPSLKLGPLITSPLVEISEVTSYLDTLLLHALFGLKERNLASIYIPFGKICADFFGILEKKFGMLVSAIADGKIPPNWALSVPLDNGVRKALQAKFTANPDRSMELQNIIKNNNSDFSGIIPKIWPNMKYVSTIHGSHYAMHIPTLKRYIGDIPLLSVVYGCSEAGLLAIPYKSGYIPHAATVYFEFVPEIYTTAADHEIPKKEIRDIYHLEVGAKYELLITTYGGLYRYRLGDLVKVIGRYNELPIMEVIGRMNTTATISYEKTTEEQIHIAADSAAKRSGLSGMGEFCVAVDFSEPPGLYCFYAAQQDVYVSEVVMADFLDEELREVNVWIDAHRNSGLIGPTKFRWVKKDTFSLLTACKAEKSIMTQAKLSLVTHDADLIAILQQNIINKSL
jgi:hypothetical protein